MGDAAAKTPDPRGLFASAKGLLGTSLTLAMSLGRSGSKLFSSSLAELRKDRDALSASDTTKPQ